jgi:hypothetical protein
MPGSRYLVVAAFMAVCVCVLPAPASAWQFEMTGGLNWAYEWYHQQGAQGLFGPYNVDNGAATATANLNFWWNGNRIVPQGIVTGSNAAISYMYMIMEPTVKINEAIKLKGRYRLAQYGNPYASYYWTGSSPGTDNAFTEGQWTMFWATAVMPWGSLSLGKRPWKFGNALQYDGTDGLTTESVVLSAPLGPLDIGVAFYPFRYAGPSQAPPGTRGDPFDLVGVTPYFNEADRSGAMSRDALAFVVYHASSVQMGVLASYGAYHVGPEAGLVSVSGAPPFVALDSQFTHGTAFFKFFCGRFFVNAEAAWLYWSDRYSGSDVFTPGLDIATSPRYVEQWRYMVEAGVVSGPSKISVLYSRTPGPDRRNGALIDKQSAAFVWHPTYDQHLANWDVFRPYNFLLAYNYGAGLNAYNLSGDGYMRDAWVLATRFDYAVAANLNIYGTFLWAERTNNGYGWGCVAPNDPADPLLAGNTVPVLLAPSGTNNGNVRIALNGAPGSPNIPDPALGWEVMLGADWQLLEGLIFGAQAAYWRPGKWFNYACVDRSVPGWDVPAAGNFWGTRPDRTIDPILGGQVTLGFSF